MPNDPSSTQFQSILAPLMDKFLQEKHACGYPYHEPTRILRGLDDFLFQEGLRSCELPRSIAQKWLAKRSHESPQNPAATDHGCSAVLQVSVSARLLRLCARFHTGASRAIEFYAKNSDS